jgi:hypothetical protein
MKKLFLLFIFFAVVFSCYTQNIWIGLGGDGQWSTATNWSSGNVPVTTDDVIINNSTATGTFTVTLPAGGIGVAIRSLTITPTVPNTITVVLPTTNTAVPGLNITGTGDAFILNTNGVFRNSTGAASGNAVAAGVLRINNGGKYVHNNETSHAALVTNLSTAAGTENGSFEFDVPGGSGYAIAVTGRNYGNLVLSAATAGTKSYTGNGASGLNVRGNLVIQSNVSYTSTMTADIRIAGNLDVSGNFACSPSNIGTTNRSILFNGSGNQIISGAGNLTTGGNFRNFEVLGNSTVTLQRDISILSTNTAFIVNTNAKLYAGTSIITGIGIFQLNTGGLLGTAMADGINNSPSNLGNIRTFTRTFSPLSSFEYNGTVTQVTGDALPASLLNLTINNTGAGGVTLQQNHTINGILNLQQGLLNTTPTALLTLNATAQIQSGASAYSELLTVYPNNIGTATSYVNGPLRVVNLSNINFVFPIGKMTHRPLILKNATGDFTVTYFDVSPYTAIVNGGVMGTGIDHVSRLEYWNIENAGAASAAVELTFSDPTSGGVTDFATLLTAKHDGSQWNNTGNTAAIGNVGLNGLVRSSVLTNFGAFALASSSALTNPLPVTINYLQGIKKNNGNYLQWRVSCNDNPFINMQVQKSIDNRLFNLVTTVNATKQQCQQPFDFTDNTTVTGLTYYRLKVTGADGKITYSNTIGLINGDNGWQLIGLQTNPVINNAVLQIAATQKQSLMIRVTTIEGKTVLQKQYTLIAGSNQLLLNTLALPAGQYFISCYDNNTAVQTVRFIKISAK